MKTRMTLGKKIIFGFGIMIVMLAVVAGLYHYAVNSATSSFAKLLAVDKKIENHADEAYKDLLQCRRNEKDFLLRKDPKYLDTFQENSHLVIECLEEVASIAQAADREETHAAAVKAIEHQNVYAEGFAKLVKAWDIRGFDHNSGLQGKFRDAVHKLEEDFKKKNLPEATIMLLQIRRSEKDYLLRGSEKYVGAVRDRIGQLREMVDGSSTANQLLDEYLSCFEQLVQQDKVIAATTAELRDSAHSAEELIDGVAEASGKAASEATAVAEAGAARTMTLAYVSLATAVGAVVIGLVATSLVTRAAVHPIRQAITSLMSGADQTNVASAQVSSAGQSLASGASQAAASIEETTAGIEEMTSMTRQNAENAEQANALMRETETIVKRGQGSMGKLNGAINEIKTSADETAKIVKTIDEIAFQTNLLALNAAVEAARAGEAGKGFAVVAEEVRNLAQRSAEAAKVTAELITQSVHNAENGVSIARDTGSAFDEIASSAAKVSQLVAEITAASAEQAQGIEQINSVIAQMDQVTQSNAANAEESASAAEELHVQARELRVTIAALQALIDKSVQQKVGTPDYQIESMPAATAVKKHQAASKTSRPKTRRAEQRFSLDNHKSLSKF